MAAFKPFRFNPLKELDVDIPRAKRKAALKEAAAFLREQMLEYIGEGKSPVTGRKWAGLSDGYKKIKGESSSVSIPNMEFSGKLLDGLSVDVSGDSLVIDVAEDDYGKAEGNYLGTYGQPKPVTGQRKFMPQAPDKTKPFTNAILSELKKVLADFED